jgi:hypothetical protein
MRYPFMRNPGHVADYGHRTPNPPADRTVQLIFFYRILCLSSLLPLLLLLAPPYFADSYVHAEATPAVGKTTITVLPAQKRDKKPQIDPAKQRARVKQLQRGIQ